MDLAFAKAIKEEHDNLRAHYYSELGFALGLFFALLVLIAYLGTFGGLNLLAPFWVILIWGGVIVMFTVILILVMPYRFRMFQKLLVLRFFEEGRKHKLELIPNPQGGQNFDYPLLLKEAGMLDQFRISVFSRYEYKKRLVHVLFDKETSSPYAIIHIPNKLSPYYLQINNGNFAPPQTYKENPIDKVAFVSRYKLNYYATSGPTNVKIYLRKELESRFVAMLERHQGTYQLIATYTDNFLLLAQYDGSRPLKLGKIYPLDYYNDRLKHLLLIQDFMNIMLEEGK